MLHAIVMQSDAQALREALRACGGLVTCAGIARRWGISRTRAHQLVNRPGFPEPVAVLGSSPVYVVSEVDQWRVRQ